MHPENTNDSDADDDAPYTRAFNGRAFAREQDKWGYEGAALFEEELEEFLSDFDLDGISQRSHKAQLTRIRNISCMLLGWMIAREYIILPQERYQEATQVAVGLDKERLLKAQAERRKGRTLR